MVSSSALRWSTRQPLVEGGEIRFGAQVHCRSQPRIVVCLNRILSIDFQVDAMVHDTATLPLSMGGLGLTCQPADCVAMIRARHPDVAAQILRKGLDVSPTWQASESAARSLLGVGGVGGWGLNPLHGNPSPRVSAPLDREPDDSELGGVRHGWQHEAASRIERQFRGMRFV